MKQSITIKLEAIKRRLDTLWQYRQKRPAWVIAIILLVCGAAAFVSSAYNRRAASVITQGRPQQTGRLRSKLSFQPEADRFRRRLGKRFLEAGREVSVMVGTLTIGGNSLPVRIVRSQDDDQERVAIAAGGGPASLTWSGTEGALSAGRQAVGVDRSLIERIALDSPDQFILAQTRGASYRTVARNVVPKGAADQEDYSGPSWDVVLVGEPNLPDSKKPLSDSRVYYINTATGLLDKIVSQESSQTVVAELSGWADHAGEKVPSRVVWKQNDQVVMELNLTGTTHGPRQ